LKCLPILCFVKNVVGGCNIYQMNTAVVSGIITGQSRCLCYMDAAKYTECGTDVLCILLGVYLIPVSMGVERTSW
jgi:hypothetical protein